MAPRLRSLLAFGSSLLLTLPLLLGSAACDGSASQQPAAPEEGKHHDKDKDKDKAHGRAGRAAEGASGSAMAEGSGAAAPAADDHKDKDHKDKDKEKDKDKKKDDGGAKDSGSSGGAGSGAAAGGGAAGSRAHGHDAGENDVVFYVSMHGDKGGNTISGITKSGTVVGSVLKPPAEGDVGATLRDLRGMCLLGDGSLLVVNAWMQDTRIVQYGPAGADGTRQFQKVFIKGGTMNPALQHTYSVVVAPDGSIYCSNQDSNTVTRYAGPGATTPGAPLPPPPSLSGFGNLPPGIFVPNVKTSPEGLAAVRGIAFGPDGKLYVADRDGARVSRYDPVSGAREAIVMAEKDGLKHPIQIAFTQDGKYMFVGDNGVNGVYRKNLDTGEVDLWVKPGTAGLDAPSAIVMADGHLYVGNRKGRSILRFKYPEGKPEDKPFVEKLPDDPEYLLPIH